ncbi:MAG: hypothetical protein U0325_16890 [Polyangiales bacterium]
MRATLLALTLAACTRGRTDVSPPRDAAAPEDRAPTHVCYGAGGSAVEVARTLPCEALGASEQRPATVPAPPPARRTRNVIDAGLLF